MPSEHAKQLEALWQKFRTRWPLKDLHEMKLEQYNAQGNDDSFCYWIESRLEELGSILGGSAFKFGVYSRKDKTEKKGGAGRDYNDQYGWMTKYGDSPETAFDNVKKEIIKVAEAAAKGELQTVQEANLGEVIRWKIAFLYQNPQDPKVVPMYKLSVLRALLDSPKISAVDAQKRLRKMVEDKNLAGTSMFDYAKSLWKEGVEKMERLNLTIDTAKDFLDFYSDWSALDQVTSSLLVGYRTQDDFPLALKLNEKSVQLILKSDNWQTKVSCSTVKLQPNYILSEDLSNDLVSKELALTDHELVLVTVTTMNELEAVCIAYEGSEIETLGVEQVTTSLNQILYGPPGTGKTYATTELAVKITDPEYYKSLCEKHFGKDLRDGIKAKYDDLVSRGRIDFATFHQSFSYEDFVEGIRAETSDDDDSLTYKVAEGVFKHIADLASKTIAGENSLGLAESPTIWKISIGRRDEVDIRNQYINAGEARIGWNDTGDLSVPLDDRNEHEQQYWNGLTSPNHNVLNDFSENMKVGDVLLCFKDQFAIGAIGVVKSEYKFDADASAEDRDFAHIRDVNWLVKGISLDVRHLNGGKRMVQKTLYPLGRINWNSLISEMKRQGVHVSGINSTDESKPSPNHVIIIDEINRGNTARIFGELITLLEPDKRKGGSDERTVILPYSKEPFTVPSNLYVIGTMNTADKSLAQLDLALRRRFEFIEVMPDVSLLEGVTVHGVSIKSLLQTINDRIEILLDRDHLIGHSYFLPLKSAEDESSKISLLADIFKKRVIPLLQEYFFADWEKIAWVLNDIGKPKEFQFVQLGESKNKLSQLFSADIAAELIDRRYQINEGAFHAPQPYQGIFLGSHE